MMKKRKSGQMQFELFVIWVLWKEEYIDVTTVLNGIEQIFLVHLVIKNFGKFLTRRSKRKTKRKILFSINLH